MIIGNDLKGAHLRTRVRAKISRLPGERRCTLRSVRNGRPRQIVSDARARRSTTFQNCLKAALGEPGGSSTPPARRTAQGDGKFTRNSAEPETLCRRCNFLARVPRTAATRRVHASCAPPNFPFGREPHTRRLFPANGRRVTTISIDRSFRAERDARNSPAAVYRVI